MRYLLASFWLISNWVAAAEGQWMDDLPSALSRAQAEDKAVLLTFSGEDEFSRKLVEEVFLRPEFIQFAETNLVLVEADLSGDKGLPADQVSKNEKLASEFQIEGTPIVFLLNKNGVQLGKGGYVEGGATNYIAMLQRAAAAADKSADGASTNPPATNTQPSIYLPSAPAITYDRVILQGITVGKQKIALINGKSLAEGETARIKISDKPVSLECLQIGDGFVTVRIEGEEQPRKVSLGEKQIAPAHLDEKSAPVP